MQFMDIDFDSFDVPEFIHATDKQLKLAHRRALGRTLTWLSTRLNREIAAKYDLPQRVFKVRSKKKFDDDSGSLWIGLNPLVARYIGALRQTKKGVSVRSHRFAGAFLAKMPNGHVGVFERGERTIKDGKVHYPIKKVLVALNDGSEEDKLLKKYESESSKYYEKVFRQQLQHIQRP